MTNFDGGAVILLVLGSLLTVIGGLTTAYVTLHLNSRAAKKTILREKIEQIYLLTNQIKRWSQTQLFELSKQKGMPPAHLIIDPAQLTQQQKPFYDMDLDDLKALLTDVRKAQAAARQTSEHKVKMEYLRKLVTFDIMENFKFWYEFDPPTEVACPIDGVEMLVNLYLPQLSKTVDTYGICIFNVKSLLHREVNEQEVRDIFMLFEMSHRNFQHDLEKLVLSV